MLEVQDVEQLQLKCAYNCAVWLSREKAPMCLVELIPRQKAVGYPPCFDRELKSKRSVRGFKRSRLDDDLVQHVDRKQQQHGSVCAPVSDHSHSHLPSSRTHDASSMDNKKQPSASAFFSPAGLLKRGLNGLSSPITAVKDTVMAAATPRSLLTPSSRMAQPSPAEYPSLFDVRTPSSTRSDGGHYSHSMSGFHDRELSAPSSARSATSGGGGFARSNSSRTSSRTSSSSRTGSRGELPPRPVDASRTGSASLKTVEDMDDDERAYLEVCHHNLHSVLTNPKASNWTGALLDVFAPLETDLGMLPFPGLDLVHVRDFEPYLRKHGKLAKQYEANHVKPISEQLSSKNVPSISVADGQFRVGGSVAAGVRRAD